MTEAYTYSVGELNRLIKELVEGSGAVAHVQVRGEVSNFKRYPSGHCYFSLKDKTGVLKCVMFRRQALRLTADPVNGATVVAIGRIGVYERDGAYQLYADLLVPEGTGDLMQAYEKLKNKLATEGLFDETRKQPLPAHPQRIGIITSPAGAAVRDVIIVARNRDSGVRLLLYPVLVQGKGAAAEIAHAIDFMNRKQLADVLIVGRGGGSMEDLWAFNEEPVIEAVFNSNTPVISAVGHETDFTITDFVADLRAPTPSAAAELAVFDIQDFYGNIGQYRMQMNRLMKAKLDIRKQKQEYLKRQLLLLSPQSRIHTKRHFAADKRAATPSQAAEMAVPDSSILLHTVVQSRQRLERALLRQLDECNAAYLRLAASPLLRDPTRLLERSEERLDKALMRLRQTLPLRLENRAYRLQQALRLLQRPERMLLEREQRWQSADKSLRNAAGFWLAGARRQQEMETNLTRAIEATLRQKQTRLSLLAARLQAVSPLGVLARGYSVTLGESGQLIKSVADVGWGAEIRTKLYDGTIYSVIQQVERDKDHGNEENGEKP